TKWFEAVEYFFHHTAINDVKDFNDYAMAESFFSNLNSERIKHLLYQTRAESQSDIFDYMEGFFNRDRLHKYLYKLCILQFERKQTLKTL
ncbi:MAG: IS3 family transposase, partial [Limnohabitans sp.]